MAGITCLINGQAVTRAQVLEWEFRRMRVVWQKLKPCATSPVASQLNDATVASNISAASIAQMRQDLLLLKLQLGPQRIKEVLADELALSGMVERLLVSTSFGRYTLSVTDIQCPLGSAEGFVQWFAGRVQANDEPAMLLACPDHYVIETLQNGQQYVLETTGGSPLASQFDIDYTNASGNPVALASGLPARVGGVAMDGPRTIGYAYHQFGTQAGGGFRGRLSVAFPWSTPWFMIDGHRWHLACEFSNWIEGYLRSLS
ncbi:MAG: hypothetical protein EPO09_19155 [Aquabacterium sp.]|uniref:hypothetical protein n=1 Tax=Aquabacterium sp. TaxID=1872578 RepID=UPI001229BE46|nr:hypothetical protein [Aquabacterium sp.]TAK87021.1 MAG: hypothetical protein EPO09_19155 [Aquabacterium sp.]